MNSVVRRSRQYRISGERKDELIGDAETVARKVLYINQVLGGLSRITFQMGVSALPHDKMLRSIEILGTYVAPKVRKELRSDQLTRASRLVRA